MGRVLSRRYSPVKHRCGGRLPTNSRNIGTTKSPGSATQTAIASDQHVGRAVVLKVRFSGTLQFGNDARREDFAQLHAPLIEGVDSPNRTLRENAMFIEGHQRADDAGRQFFSQDPYWSAGYPRKREMGFESWANLRPSTPRRSCRKPTPRLAQTDLPSVDLDGQ